MRVRDLSWSAIDFRLGPERRIAHNTYAGIEVTGRNADNEIIGWPYVLFHSTIIVRKVGKNLYCLNTDGWQTSTTKQRINALLGNIIHQKDFNWFVTDDYGTRPFEDNMVVTLKSTDRWMYSKEVTKYRAYDCGTV